MYLLGKDMIQNHTKPQQNKMYKNPNLSMNMYFKVSLAIYHLSLINKSQGSLVESFRKTWN